MWPTRACADMRRYTLLETLCMQAGGHLERNGCSDGGQGQRNSLGRCCRHREALRSRCSQVLRCVQSAHSEDVSACSLGQQNGKNRAYKPGAMQGAPKPPPSRRPPLAVTACPTCMHMQLVERTYAAAAHEFEKVAVHPCFGELDMHVCAGHGALNSCNNTLLRSVLLPIQSACMRRSRMRMIGPCRY